MSIMLLLTSMNEAAELFRKARWANGLVCPNCNSKNITKYCRYQKSLQRYTCKECNRTFNDKTGTLLHYKHIDIQTWMTSVWRYMCDSPNGVSIHHISESIKRTYKYTYYMIRDIMARICSLPEEMLSGTCETDELYIRTASKGVPLKTNGEDRITPSRRGLSRHRGRGTFEKNTPMITIYYQRADDTQRDKTIFHVPRDGKTLVAMVQERIKTGSRIMTDEHNGYKKLGKVGYEHLTVNHSEDEYASGPNNEIHTNNCECRVNLSKWWLKKHRGVSKWHLEQYVKTFQFIHNNRHHSGEELLLVTMKALLADRHQQSITVA